ncbi:hypothetical protein LCI18_009114 [Fusarium solani-melongenae]|uniref:Uncharacterized protein n=1 Tax=Fusarium solani subsp. cucurbitae TaxID=2747967 RepID=A0ACD3ZAC3_FUSSC|nr:hypothetical protein LCI18_009114 [Fusarium solani-melongenae]
MPLTPIKPSERIDSWRQRVPSRLERRGPFEGDGFEERPSTRLTFREASPPARRPSTRLSFFRAATPLFGRPSTSESSRPSSGLLNRPVETKRKRLLGIFNGKRRRRDSEVESIPRQPIHLNFLFVGSKSAGQTSLLFRARYGYFPDSDAFSRPLYETYVNERTYNDHPRLTYIPWDAVFLCFNISDKVSMYTIMQWWYHASHDAFAKTEAFQPLLYLVGLKKDLRDQCFLEDHRTGSALSPSGLMAYPTCCVCSSEANWQAKRIGAHRYLECSAATGQGMREVFEDSTREAARRALGEEIQEEETAVPKKRRRFF